MAKDTWKKKKWHKVIAPPLFADKVLGESPAAEPKELVGRIITSTLMELTGDFKKYYVRMKFKVKEVKGDEALTEIVGHSILKEHVTKMVRRRSSRIDYNDVFELKDGTKIRVKVLAVLPRKATASTETSIRKKIEEYLKKNIPKQDFTTFYASIISDKTQVSIKKVCSKIYPVREVEIRKTEVQGK